MRSIKRSFENITAKNPYWSSYVCFTEAIKHKNFAPKIIAKWFNILVKKDDYPKLEKKWYLDYLQKLSKPSEEGIKLGVIEP